MIVERAVHVAWDVGCGVIKQVIQAPEFLRVPLFDGPALAA